MFTNETGEELSKKQAAQEATIRKLRAQAWSITLSPHSYEMPFFQTNQVCCLFLVEARFVSLKKKSNG
jgi:hypothetical protein